MAESKKRKKKKEGSMDYLGLTYDESMGKYDCAERGIVVDKLVIGNIFLTFLTGFYTPILIVLKSV